MKHEKLTFQGLKHKPETLLKMRKARLGTKQSEETRALLSKIKRDAGKWSREDNPNWMGGISAENRLARHNGDYIRWRRQVLKKYGNECSVCHKSLGGICGCCGQKEQRFVHHIKDFTNFPSLRYDVSNGCILCYQCHRNIENLANSVKPRTGNAEPIPELNNSGECVETIYETTHN